MDEAHTYFVGDGQWLVHNCGGPDGDGKKEFPNPGEIPQGALGEGRALASSLPITKKKYGKIQNPLSGLYEFRDKLTGKWYVGQASDLRARLQSHFDAGRFDNWDDVVVTFVSARTRTLDFIEQIRIDQIASLVGGYKNTINKVNPTIPKGALLWWNQGEWMKIVNYPKWLTPPKNFYHD